MLTQLQKNNKAIRELRDMFRKGGLPEHLIKPLLANIGVETAYTFNAETKQKKGPAFGLNQWETGTVRYNLLNDWMVENKRDINNVQDQVDYMISNFMEESRPNSEENWAGERNRQKVLNSKGNSKQITTLISDLYYRPKTPHLDRRLETLGHLENMEAEWLVDENKKIDSPAYPFWNTNKNTPQKDKNGYLYTQRLDEQEDLDKQELAYNSNNQDSKLLKEGGSLITYKPLENDYIENLPEVFEESEEPSTTMPKNNYEVKARVEKLAPVNWGENVNKWREKEDAETENLTTKSTSNNNNNTPGPEQYESLWGEYLSKHPEHAQFKGALTGYAKRESNFNNIQNTAGAPAYGYFQLYKGNWGSNTGEDLLKDPIKQIGLAIQLYKNNMSTFTEQDWEKGKKQGYSKDAMLAGAWLGGVGNVRKFLNTGVSASDGHHYPNGKGDNIKARMDLFNLKEGGLLNSNHSSIKIGEKVYNIRIAETEEEKSEGLSKESELSEDEGMLFILNDKDKDKDRLIWFTMEDTEIPLDIIFIDDDLEVVQVSKGEPLSKDPIYGKGNYVLEVNQDSGIKVGDELEFKTDKKINTKMMVLDVDGNPQMTLDGGERIFSIHNTKILIRFAKKSNATDKDNDYKALGKRVFKFLEVQNNNEPEYV